MLPPDLNLIPPEIRAKLNVADRELQTLILLADGHSHKSAAQILSLSPRTIQTHAANACDKMGKLTQAKAELMISYTLIQCWVNAAIGYAVALDRSARGYANG